MAREQGYIITVKAFVPVNPRDLTDTVAKATALQKVKDGGTLKDLADLGADVLKIDQRFTSREKGSTTVEGEGEAGSEEAEAEETEQPGDEQPAPATRRRSGHHQS